MTRLVTNAHWAKNSKKALRTIKTLKEAGLDEINFSTGDEHAKFVPIQNVINAISASIFHHLKPAIMVEDRNGRTITKNKILRNPEIKKLLSKDKSNLTFMESPWMPLDPFKIEQYQKTVTANKENWIHS